MFPMAETNGSLLSIFDAARVARDYLAAGPRRRFEWDLTGARQTHLYPR